VDRLILGVAQERLVCSNSFAAALGYTGATLDAKHDYQRESYAILKGVRRYDTRLRVLHPSFTEWHQLYFHPVDVSSGVTERAAPPPNRDFHDFEAFFTQVRTVLGRIAHNARDPDRRAPMPVFSTLSRGYDSPAANILFAPFGIARAFTIPRSNSMIPPWLQSKATHDDGARIGAHLDIETIRLSPVKKSTLSRDEIFFLAPSTAPAELAFAGLVSSREETGEAALLLTGYHGGLLSRAVPKRLLTSDLVRNDTSGLNLSEVRLKAGLVHLPVPFVFARSIVSLNALSQSQAMAPWSVGGDYDKPIARRIIEEAGIPRSAFGERKRAVVQEYALPQSPTLRTAFRKHLRCDRGVRAFSMLFLRALDRLVFLTWRLVYPLLNRVAGGAPAPTALPILGRKLGVSHELHTWALTRLAEYYRERLPSNRTIACDSAS
jgi:hypothetical protein